jgi:hypothetical protein
MYSRRQRLPGDSKHQIIDEDQIEEKIRVHFFRSRAYPSDRSTITPKQLLCP